MNSLSSQCQRILLGTDLASKLAAAPVDGMGTPPAFLPSTPARNEALAITHGVDRLPKLGELTSPAARAVCLQRFANHELQAVELFAWAILRFPDTPDAFRLGLWNTLQEEQLHLSLYLQRLAHYGQTFPDGPLSGNLWEHAGKLESPLAFLCAVGLTFESANLDFTLLYRDAFNKAGAAEDAAVMERIHQDEMGHVGWALSWVRRFKDPAVDDLDTYNASIPFPLGLHRAKGRNFLASARKKTGMDARLIEAMRNARSPQEMAPRHPKR